MGLTAVSMTFQCHGNGSGDIDPRHRKRLTLYHVNPSVYGLTPVDMDLADASGALVSQMMSMWPQRGPATGLDCVDAEQRGSNLVVTRLDVEVDKRYGNYFSCNICQAGRDPWYTAQFQHDEPTKWKMRLIPEYRCHCNASSPDAEHDQCLDTKVGKKMVYGQSVEDVEDSLSRSSPASDFYLVNTASRLGGSWYSLLRAGLCTETSSQCSWRLAPKSVAKRITKACADISIFSYIEGKDKKGCFRACGYTFAGKHSLARARNTSDPCWLGCLFSTALGQQSNSKQVGEKVGLNRKLLLQAWDRPFASENASLGGCPALDTSAPEPEPGGGVDPGSTGNEITNDNGSHVDQDANEWKAHHYALAIAAGCVAIAGLCTLLKLCLCVKHRSPGSRDSQRVVLPENIGARFSTEPYWGAE